MSQTANCTVEDRPGSIPNRGLPVLTRPFPPALVIACAAGAIAERVARDRHRPSQADPVATDEASARFVGDIGYRAFFDPTAIDGRSRWPIPYMRNSQELAAFGAQRGVLRDQPAEGDVALSWCPSTRRFLYSALVVEVIRNDGAVVIARVYDAASGNLRGRSEAFRPRRGDRFLRWADLLE